MTKTCSVCKETKLKSNFGKCANSKDNLKPYCKDCSKVQWKKNVDKIKEGVIKAF